MKNLESEPQPTPQSTAAGSLPAEAAAVVDVQTAAAEVAAETPAPDAALADADAADTVSKREMIMRLIASLHPQSDLADDEVLFAHIFDDYAAYAQVLEQREVELAKARAEGVIEGRNARIEELIKSSAPEPSPVPDLAGANTVCRPGAFTSIFDIARGF